VPDVEIVLIGPAPVEPVIDATVTVKSQQNVHFFQLTIYIASSEVFIYIFKKTRSKVGSKVFDFYIFRRCG